MLGSTAAAAHELWVIELVQACCRLLTMARLCSHSLTVKPASLAPWGYVSLRDHGLTAAHTGHVSCWSLMKDAAVHNIVLLANMMCFAAQAARWPAVWSGWVVRALKPSSTVLRCCAVPRPTWHCPHSAARAVSGHDACVALHAALQGQVGAVACIGDGGVLRAAGAAAAHRAAADVASDWCGMV